jgi:Ca2+-binding EF-hand superfamily protein
MPSTVSGHFHKQDQLMKHASLLRAAVIGAAIAGVGLALAQQQSDPAKRDAMIEARFKAADKDGDGKLTQDEAAAGMPRVAKNFDKIDKERKGYVTLDEIRAAMAAVRSQQ